MARHLTTGDMARIMTGTAKEWHLRHLASCPSCEKRLAGSRRILEPVPGLADIEPSPAVRARVLATYRMTFREKTTRRIPFLMPALAGACVLLITITALLLVRNTTETGYETLTATVSLKGAAPATSRTLQAGDTFTTGRGERIAVSIPEDMILDMGPDTVMAVDQARRAGGEDSLSLRLERGCIHGSFVHRENRRYDIHTPHGRVDSIGTSFYLSVNNEMTDVILTEGMLRVTARNGLSMTLEAGNTCHMTGESLNSAPSEGTGIQKLKEIIEGPADMAPGSPSGHVTGGIERNGTVVDTPAGDKPSATADPRESRETRRQENNLDRRERDEMRREQRAETGRDIRNMQRELGGRERRGLLP